MMKNGKRLELFVLTLLIVSVMFLGIRASGSSSTTILVAPPVTTVSPSENFVVDIYIENVIDLYGFQAILSWDPLLLDVVDVGRGDFLPDGHAFFYLTNQTEGWVYVCSPFDVWDFSGVDGSGTLANVTFHCTGSGECVLDLKATKLYNNSPVWVPTPPYLGDADGDLIVNWRDLFAILACFNYQEYNPSADFNSDGLVDLYDLLCLVFNYMMVYPNDALQPVEIAHDVQDGYVNPEEQVGGIVIPTNKLALFASYIGLASAILVSGIAVALYAKHIKRRKEK